MKNWMQGLHAHEQAPQTEGRTIHWVRLYNALFGPVLRPTGKMTIELAQVKPRDKVLDVGCGSGRLTILAKTYCGPSGEVHGLDAAPEMIALARRKTAKTACGH